jgi:hypothetical protein
MLVALRSRLRSNRLARLAESVVGRIALSGSRRIPNFIGFGNHRVAAFALATNP